MVAVDPWDIHGTQQVGMVGVGLNRGGTYPTTSPRQRSRSPTYVTCRRR